MFLQYWMYKISIKILVKNLISTYHTCTYILILYNENFSTVTDFKTLAIDRIPINHYERPLFIRHDIWYTVDLLITSTFDLSWWSPLLTFEGISHVNLYCWPLLLILWMTSTIDHYWGLFGWLLLMTSIIHHYSWPSLMTFIDDLIFTNDLCI